MNNNNALSRLILSEIHELLARVNVELCVDVSSVGARGVKRDYKRARDGLRAAAGPLPCRRAVRLDCDIGVLEGDERLQVVGRHDDLATDSAA